MTCPNPHKTVLGLILMGISALASGQDTTSREQTPAVVLSPPPVEMTREEDHQNMLEQLGIKSIRRGASGSQDAPNAANYDESLANPYPHLPDPLLTNDRRRVTTPEMWWEVRRPEIVEFFDREIHGRVPAKIPDVDWEVTNTVDEKVGDVDVTSKTVVGHVDKASGR